MGKSTLIRSLVKHYTRRNLGEVKGPITLVSGCVDLIFSMFLCYCKGRNRRITLVECPNDINAMVDLGKAADLVLLLIDAHYGFEMVTLSELKFVYFFRKHLNS